MASAPLGGASVATAAAAAAAAAGGPGQYGHSAAQRSTAQHSMGNNPPVVAAPLPYACDRCRRRKAKCEYLSAVDSCTHCRDAHVQCTFDLPLARRGPKARKKSDQPGQPPPDPSSLSTGARGSGQMPPPLSFSGPAAGGLQPFNSSSLSPETAWEPVEPLSIENGLPRQPLGDLPGLSTIQNISTRQRWLHLAHAMTLRNTTLERVSKRCIDLFFDYLYPLTPLVYEPALREVLAYIFSQPLPGINQPSPLSQLTPDPTAGTTPLSSAESWAGFGQPGSRTVGSRLAPWVDSTFTLVTAVCAEAAFMLPKDIFPEGESVSEIFLEASRDCLHQHLEADLENPTANSIAIRYFHSNCLHAAGKPKYSWHIFGEAIRLAQVMHLHEEASLEGLVPIEAEFRRRCFWILYLGDKSAAILNNRPITIHKYCFDTGITTLYPSGIEDEFLNTASDPPRKSFISGFNANVRLWQSAADLLLEIRVLQDQMMQHFRGSMPPNHVLPSADRQHLDSLYVRFITCLDDLPPYLQSCTLAMAAMAEGNGSAESKQYVIQCINLQVTFHCLRMVITQKFEDLSYFAPGVEQADLRKSEIVRDMLRVMNEAPFWGLQANGEPNVEKIRLIGASLLAIIHRNQDSPLATRARSDFSVLLDILTRLDSKASDQLRSTSNTVVG
ncbi:uncharacterized protein TRIVIDRAFT_190368 [Trichoderma virens Gv29-8]|uniref:Zn(2)-C6 fungal-type domain-containing protein n=1 Tax=Hypocrea virens (strain Gv29-8 / FGSC 10586) TaxID=413071 RepID=G9MNA4_HYPVG|nr:uncharacterized protein TRIVIDRAFT_190368 [Trichoderma virens Gv29-8]EHK23360.1 hypothetical protein TRIVIDRAFT_190368 [Trichoderma virens Gv29-8]